MISLSTIFTILLIHWLADFVLQTDKQARGKSSNWSDLLEHTMVYSFIMGLCMCFLLYPYKYSSLDPSLFALSCLIFHTLTDYYTSRLNSKLWKEGKVHYFFVSVGFDQILHYVQLILTYYLLTKY